MGGHWSLCPSEPPVDVGGRSACAPSAEKVKHCDPSSRMRETGIGNSAEKRRSEAGETSDAHVVRMCLFGFPTAQRSRARSRGRGPGLQRSYLQTAKSKRSSK